MVGPHGRLRFRPRPVDERRLRPHVRVPPRRGSPPPPKGAPHQWWGHTVGFASGRDQWMSEGFAQMSASLYISMIEKNPKKFIEFWNDERDLLLETPKVFAPLTSAP